MKKDFYCAEILSGNIPIDIIHETENVLAFRHTRPSYHPVHIMVIPKFHTLNLVSFIKDHPDCLEELMDVIQKIMTQVEEEHGGCRLTTNVGKFQETKHLHWHIYTGEEMM